MQLHLLPVLLCGSAWHVEEVHDVSYMPCHNVDTLKRIFQWWHDVLPWSAKVPSVGQCDICDTA